MQEPTTGNEQQVPQLINIEARVLGTLMEKQLTTPDQYPLTLNSLITACNQKSSRSPISNYTQGDIARTLIELEHKKFVHKEYGSRAEKYTQKFISKLELTRKHQAVLCVMMLRGPQTLSELSTRTQRMVEFSDKHDLQHTLDRLCDREVPFVVRLGQQAGQRGERFGHLFSGQPQCAPNQKPAQTPSEFATATNTPAVDNYVTSNKAPETASSAVSSSDIQSLKLQITSLQEESTELKKQLAALYELTGHTQPPERTS